MKFEVKSNPMKKRCPAPGKTSENEILNSGAGIKNHHMRMMNMNNKQTNFIKENICTTVTFSLSLSKL